jgi:hypothetical protein
LCEVGEGGLVVVVGDVAIAIAVTADADDDVVADMVVIGTVANDVVDVAAAVTVIGDLAVFAAAVTAVATGAVVVADVRRTRGGGPGMSSSLSSVLSSRGVGVDLV